MMEEINVLNKRYEELYSKFSNKNKELINNNNNKNEYLFAINNINKQLSD